MWPPYYVSVWSRRGLGASSTALFRFCMTCAEGMNQGLRQSKFVVSVLLIKVTFFYTQASSSFSFQQTLVICCVLFKFAVLIFFCQTKFNTTTAKKRKSDDIMTSGSKTLDPKKINADLERFPFGELANWCTHRQTKPVISCDEVLIGMTIISEIVWNIMIVHPPPPPPGHEFSPWWFKIKGEEGGSLFENIFLSFLSWVTIMPDTHWKLDQWDLKDWHYHNLPKLSILNSCHKSVS